MNIEKAFKYRIYPNKEQRVALEKQFGSARFVFNHFLNRRIDHFAKTGKGLNYYDTAKELTHLKKQSEYIWLKDANSQSLQFALKSLDTAYIIFFRNEQNSQNLKREETSNHSRYYFAII